MLEELHPKYATKVTHHKQRVTRDLIHHEHVPSKAASARGARESLHSCYDLIGTKAAELHNLYRRPERSLTKAGITLCLAQFQRPVARGSIRSIPRLELRLWTIDLLQALI